MKRCIPIVLVVGLLFSNCSKDEEKNLQLIKARTFSINAPDGWTLIEDQGVDTYIGRITNENTTIYFDQGHLSFGGLENVQENDETVYFSRTHINGVPAIIHKENTPHETSASTRLSVYLDNGEKQNRLYVFDPDNDAFFIRIFKTHRFL